MYIAAVDLGAESGRVVLGRFDGQKLDIEVLHRFKNISVPLNGRLCWDTQNIFYNILQGLRLAVQKAAPEKVMAVGIDSWGVDFGILDGHGHLMGIPVHYRDDYTVGISEEIAGIIGKERLFERTGLAVWPFNTINQLFALKKENATNTIEGDTLLFTPDLLNYWLCGVKANELSIASTSQCLDISGKEYATDILAELGIPSDIFAKIVDTGTVLGNITPEIMREIGADYEIKVIATASHDTAAAVVATPFENSKTSAFLSCGTWSLIGVEREKPLISEQARKLNFTNERGIDRTYRVLANVMGLWLSQQAKAVLEREGKEYSYEELASLAKEGALFESFIDPNDLRFYAPADMITEIKGYCLETGQKIPETVSEIMCCILQSLACAYRLAIDNLEEMTGEKIETLHIIGGGSQNTTLCEWSANALDRKVTAGPVEGTSMGNILVQLKTLGVAATTSELRGIVKRSTEIIEYTKTADWEAGYMRFKEVTGK